MIRAAGLIAAGELESALIRQPTFFPMTTHLVDDRRQEEHERIVWSQVHSPLGVFSRILEMFTRSQTHMDDGTVGLDQIRLVETEAKVGQRLRVIAGALGQ